MVLPRPTPPHKYRPLQRRLRRLRREPAQLAAQFVAQGLRLLEQLRAQGVEAGGRLELAGIGLDPMGRDFVG